MTHALADIAATQLAAARAAANGRSALTVFGGHEHTLRQTVLALVAGQGLDEHESPGEATLYVLTGHVRLSAGSDAWEARAGELLPVPPRRHGLQALDDSAVLLTVAKTP